ncbi:lysM domain receptor-like kinase 3 [Argentina anserina]|uniref:lysM domain receptor-like kinase 3 n=1 Tax=Argentina anserina TaxID=57926 RepID=UPI0021766DE6|nr:lysM domain receptor-like kinase 3 [Potentilla anserina]
MDMACLNFFFVILTTLYAAGVSSASSTTIHPFTCSASHDIRSCNSELYHVYTGHEIGDIVYFYSVSVSDVKPVNFRGQNKKDYRVSVPCSCKNIDGIDMYVYDTKYIVKPGDSFERVAGEYFSRQALRVEGNKSSIHLVCGCVKKSQVVVTYTVQEHDTLSEIGQLLEAYQSEIEIYNMNFTSDPSFVDVGWVLYVPSEKNGIRAEHRGKRLKVAVVIGVAAVCVVFVATFIVIILMRNRICWNLGDDVHLVNSSVKKRSSLKQQFFKKEMEETFESEKPAVYTMEEIKEATNNFDDTRKIGEGGYGCVYVAILGEAEVAIKNMRSTRTKEFFAELKVLCKIHHNNVVELLGYASGSEHLCLVYEFVQNGSLNDHLHDPLLKGRQPLSWTARAQIALDTARGIEYIHDHTKKRYVHRDIKTSNILLDEGLRAKVADFGLVRLAERSNEEDTVATRVVGTPGYIPPESVRELQMTSKSDVYAFGVVLGELITGQRAIVRDNREPKRMRSLVSILYEVFKDDDPEIALEAKIDGNLNGSYPIEEVYKMGEIARWCSSEDPINRPEMRDIVQSLSHILLSSVEWDASLGGKSEVFSGLVSGR